MINKPTELVIDKICRSCMCQNDKMRDVFESKELSGKTLQIADILMECTTCVVTSGDGLPHLLCIHCENKLSIAYEFKQQCLKSETALRELTTLTSQTDSVIKEESLDIIVQPDFNIPAFYRHESDDSEDDSPSSKKQSSFTCTFCKKELRTKKGLRIHQRRHTGEKLRTCHVCNTQFTRTHHLIRHMKTHMKSDAGHICGECGMSFMKLSHLLSHKKMHKSENVESAGQNDEEQSGTAMQNSSDNEAAMETNDDEDDEDYKEENEELYESKIKARKKDNNKLDNKETFQCQYCLKIMTTFVGLKIHMRRHTGSDLAKCNMCDKSFTKSSHLKRHLQTHGVKEAISSKPVTKKEVMECEFCDRQFKYKKSFNHHMQTEHGMSDESDAPLISFIKEDKPVIQESTSSQINPEAEKTIPTENNPPELVGEEVKADTTATDSKSRSKVHICHVCQASFARINHLTRHMTLHRALLIHKCDRCDKAFATEEHLTQHVEEDHINKPYVCTICNRPFSRGEHLIRHLKIHQSTNEKDDNSLKCCICDNTFARSDHLARHIKIHLIQDKRHVCKQCNKAFNRLDNLKTHQRVHTGVKDTTKLHLCVYCGKEFNNSSNMIVHMRRHTGERPYKCTECGKGFPRSHDLKCHERTHSGEKPYHCSICGKSFNKSNKLLRHTRVHTGERPYVCNICGRAFTQSNDLALHMRRHTGARPYACGVCPARFIQSGQLKAHRRTSGHWMETQPDLKGGHRVEPVSSTVPPSPIRFKTHGKPKKEEELPEANGQDAQTVNFMAEIGENMMIESKMVELEQSGLIDIVESGGEIKFKDSGSFIVPVKNEMKQVDAGGGNLASSTTTTTVTFQEQSNSATVTYSIVAPNVATFSADYSNYPNFN